MIKIVEKCIKTITITKNGLKNAKEKGSHLKFPLYDTNSMFLRNNRPSAPKKVCTVCIEIRVLVVLFDF